MNSQITNYQIVQMNKIPYFRQMFLDSINFGEDRKLFSGIRYIQGLNSVNTFTGREEAVSFSFDTETREIKIGFFAFHNSLSQFMRTLKKHELHHARQLYENPEKVNSLIYQIESDPTFSAYGTAILEIPAMINEQNDLVVFGSANLKEKRRNDHWINRFEQIARDEGQKLGRNFLADLNSILCKLPHDKLVRERYGL